MDINLPGIQGDEATVKIKSTFPALPVIALTADVIIETDTLREKGFDAVLTKPIDSTQLVNTLNHHLK